MLKTCFSTRKGFHLQDSSTEYELNSEVAKTTVGFEQLSWNNELTCLIPGYKDPLPHHNHHGADDDDTEGDEHVPLVELKKVKLTKLERKELRKLKRSRRKLPKHLRLPIHFEHNYELNFKELVDQIKELPESFELYNTSLYRDDMYTLPMPEWINDNIITYIYNILEMYQLKPFYKENNLNENTILLIPPSLCYLVLNAKDPESLVSMFPKNFQKCKFLILPLNDGGSHWSLSVISVLDKTLCSFDSLVNLNDDENALISKNFSTIIGTLLNIDNYQLVKRDLKTPQQLNDYDCGMFVICLTCFLISELIGSHIDGKAWKLDFNLDAKIAKVDCILIRTLILKSVIDNITKKRH